MNKKILLLFIFLLAATAARAQNYHGKKIAAQQNILKLGLFGVEYEHMLSQNITLVSEAGVAFSAGFGGRQIGWIFDYTPMAGLSPRYYYNLEKRAAKDKNTKYFSGNYLSFYTQAYLYNLVHKYEKNEYLFGPVWGLQRDIGRGFQIGFQAGIGMGGPVDNLDITPLLGFHLGYRLN